MARINQKSIHEVFSLLNTKYFTASDFDVTFPDEGTTFVKIIFRHDANYQLLVTEESTGNVFAALASNEARKHKPHTRESPGNFKSFEINIFDTYEEAFQRIPSWCANINADIKARIPIFNEFEDFRRQLEERLEQHITDPQRHFTAEDQQVIAEKFDELARKFSDLEAAHTITKSQLNQALSDIESIKNNSKSFSKGMWAGITKNRLIKLLIDLASSPEGRKFALDAAEKFALGHDVTPKS